MKTNSRVTIGTGVMVGKPVIKGTRIPVDEIIEAHPRLTPEDMYAALDYSADTFPMKL